MKNFRITILILILVVLLVVIALPAAAADLLELALIEHGAMPLRSREPLPPRLSETFEYYDVQGQCSDDLRRQLRQNGIPWSDGKKYDSVTEWEVRWDYGYAHGQHSCSVDAFSVTVDIRYRYPRWQHGADAPAALVKKWDAYMRNLVDHETLHRYQVEERVLELNQAVAALPPAVSCADLDVMVRNLCRDKMKELRQDQERYDLFSGHGAAQGAVFR